jgi:hypothetical protein
MLARSIGSDVSSATAAGYSILPARQSVNQPFQAEWPNGAVVTSTESTHDGGLNEPARTLLNSAAMAAVCPSRCHRPAGGLWPTRALNDPGTIVRMAPSNMPRHQSVPLSKGRAARWQVKSTPGTPWPMPRTARQATSSRPVSGGWRNNARSPVGGRLTSPPEAPVSGPSYIVQARKRAAQRPRTERRTATDACCSRGLSSLGLWMTAQPSYRRSPHMEALPRWVSSQTDR